MLKVTWSDAAPPFVDQARLYDHIRETPPVKAETIANIGAVDAAFAKGKVIEAEYQWPYQSHASMGAACSIADVTADTAVCWTASHRACGFWVAVQQTAVSAVTSAMEQAAPMLAWD